MQTNSSVAAARPEMQTTEGVVSTPRNLERLPTAPELVALPLPRIDGLQDGAEATSDVPYYDKFVLHRKAFDGLAAPFAAFLDAACAAVDGARRRPNWVIADFIHHWVAAAAQDRNVPCAMLVPCATSIAGSAGPPPPGDSHTEQQRQAIDQSMSAVPSFEQQQATELFATEKQQVTPVRD